MIFLNCLLEHIFFSDLFNLKFNFFNIFQLGRVKIQVYRGPSKVHFKKYRFLFDFVKNYVSKTILNSGITNNNVFNERTCNN